MREKEQLAEGLHLIDFEQLKIENQSLTEKIEERNEELLKLKRKITMTVQVRQPTVVTPQCPPHTIAKYQSAKRKHPSQESRQTPGECNTQHSEVCIEVNTCDAARCYLTLSAR